MKYLLIGLFFLGLLHAEKKDDIDWNLKQTATVLASDVTIKHHYELYDMQEKIKHILNNFNVLSNSLQGFSEYYMVKKLEAHFKSKYLIQQDDLLQINNNLNEALKKRSSGTDK